MIATIIKFFSGVLLLYFLSIFTGTTIAIVVGFLAAIIYIYLDLKKIKKDDKQPWFYITRSSQ